MSLLHTTILTALPWFERHGHEVNDADSFRIMIRLVEDEIREIRHVVRECRERAESILRLGLDQERREAALSNLRLADEIESNLPLSERLLAQMRARLDEITTAPVAT